MAQRRAESLAAVIRSLGWPPFAPPAFPRRDVVVAGARRDRVVPAHDVIATAAWYGGAPLFVGDRGHVPMLGPGASEAARRLVATVSARAPARTA